MGVTINFQGQLKSKESYDAILHLSKAFAESNNMAYSQFEEKDKLLLRVRNEEDWDYQGFTHGINIQPHENSEPLNLEFDKDLYVQEYCKTQYAGVETHVKVIELLRQIEPYFDCLEVDDEGEYWESENEEVLKDHFDRCFDAIEEEKKKNQNLDGPFRMEDGRIVDLMED